ncbi:bifunctional hydroxymethylpyrimidine kinase/phosphomethylpyrimidine kinase [Limosilactobacillus sp.]|uniref:bifunctional hydroxymethylpyrimidine kinase/phosphomethylpyrimidine kinase n=1 Tax=Limosilactobacillus sp. TaxID=2773925 RepID=UPI00345EC84F
MKVTAVIEDFSGIGNMSMLTALDILHAVNITTAALPATVLSTQSEGFGQPAVMNLSTVHQFQKQTLMHWGRVANMQITNILLGYLGDLSTIDSVSHWLHCQHNIFTIIDPVMGDQGSLYPGLNQNIPYKMRQLILNASVITPNLTELKLLSGLFTEKNYDIKDYIDALRDLGYFNDCIITGIPKDQMIVSEYWSKDNKLVDRYQTKRLTGHFYGTGDVFSALFAAFVNIGLPKQKAFIQANQLLTTAIQETSVLPEEDRKYGLLMHDLLQKLSYYKIRK